MGLFSKLLDYRTITTIAFGLVAVLVFGAIFAYEPVTRNLISQDALCNTCHLPAEFNPDVRLTATRPHPALPDQPQSQAACVDCIWTPRNCNSLFGVGSMITIADVYPAS